MCWACELEEKPALKIVEIPINVKQGQKKLFANFNPVSCIILGNCCIQSGQEGLKKEGEHNCPWEDLNPGKEDL